MSQEKKLSTTFKLLRALGFNYSEEEYGDVSLWRVIWQFFHNIRTTDTTHHYTLRLIVNFA